MCITYAHNHARVNVASNPHSPPTGECSLPLGAWYLPVPSSWSVYSLSPLPPPTPALLLLALPILRSQFILCLLLKGPISVAGWHGPRHLCHLVDLT